MNETIVIIGMFLVTFGVRYPVLAAVSKIKLPDIVERGLRYVPPTVLMAIIAPAVLLPEGNHIELGFSNASFYAGILAVVIAWRMKNLLVTIIFGMGTLWLWKWLLVP